LTDWRRLNVALTRARRGLIIVGDEKTLQYDEHWKAYIEWLRKNDLIVPSSYVKAGLRDGFAAAIQRLSRNDPIPEEKNPLAGFSDISGSQEDDEESEVKQEVSLNDEEDEEDAQEAPSVESEENYDMMDSAYADDVNDAPQNENEEEDAGYNDNSLENNIEGEEEKQQEGAAEGIRSPSPSSSMEEQDNQSIDLDEDATNQIAAKGMDQGVILAEPDTMAQLIKPDPYIHERVSYNDLPTQVMKQNPHEDSNTSTDKMLEPEDSAPDTPERAAAVGEDQEGFAADIQL
jgi:DNA mismatch repair ATPase MutL